MFKYLFNILFDVLYFLLRDPMPYRKIIRWNRQICLQLEKSLLDHPGRLTRSIRFFNRGCKWSYSTATKINRKMEEVDIFDY